MKFNTVFKKIRDEYSGYKLGIRRKVWNEGKYIYLFNSKKIFLEADKLRPNITEYEYKLSYKDYIAEDWEIIELSRRMI